jgi:hypothetical protein
MVVLETYWNSSTRVAAAQVIQSFDHMSSGLLPVRNRSSSLLDQHTPIHSNITASRYSADQGNLEQARKGE